MSHIQGFWVKHSGWTSFRSIGRCVCTYVHPFQCGQTSLLEELLPGGVYTCVYTPALYVSVGAKGHGEPSPWRPCCRCFCYPSITHTYTSLLHFDFQRQRSGSILSSKYNDCVCPPLILGLSPKRTTSYAQRKVTYIVCLTLLRRGQLHSKVFLHAQVLNPKWPLDLTL